MNGEKSCGADEVAAVGGGGPSLGDLPPECIVKILSFTTPVDACRFAMVSPSFRSSANSDALWEKFLPSDYHSLTTLSASAAAAPSSSFASKKALFRSLCSPPTAFNGGNKSMWLEKESGKKCYQLAAAYHYKQTSTGGYWQKMLPASRFASSLLDGNDFVDDLDLRLEIPTAKMSPATTYAAYLVYCFQSQRCVLLDGSFGVCGDGTSCATRICLNPSKDRLSHNHRNAGEMLRLKCPKIRRDGFLEMELGQYFNVGSGLETVAAVQVRAGTNLAPVCIEGVEIRPVTGQ